MKKNESVVKLKPLNSLKILFVALIVGTELLGLLVAQIVKSGDYSFILFFFYLLLAPLSITAGGFFLGRAGKKRVEYTQPDWEFEPVQYKPDDLREMGKDYLREYIRLTPRSELWMWFLPVVLVLMVVGFLYHGAVSNTYISRMLLITGGILHPAMFAASVYVGFLAMSNEASEDFKLPLIREAIWLAEKQNNLLGFHDVRVVLDKAEYHGYEVYRSPRVFARVEYIEDDGYIESWSGELWSVSRVHARLHSGEEDSIMWYWRSIDRQFRKSVGSRSHGHYVENPPLPSSKLGVKDVENILTAAEILLLREWTELQDDHDDAENLLSRLESTVSP